MTGHPHRKKGRPPAKKRSCKGKVRYRTEGLAVTAMRTIQEQSERSRKAKRAYECPGCGGWHLTSQDERVDR